MFLFDNLLVLCKPSAAPGGGVAGAEQALRKYKLKQKFPIRRVEVVEREEEGALELRIREEQGSPGTNLLLLTKNAEEKAHWMAALVFRQSRSMLDRILESVRKEEEKRIPLILPLSEQYRFAEADVEGENILFEDYSSSSGIPIVKGGTLLKLVERLTYHAHTDNKFLRTFLTTYRSFCQPQEFLSLLLERFHVPLPAVLSEVYLRSE